MKNYIRKPLKRHQVLRVLSVHGLTTTEMQRIREPFIIEGVPSGCFVLEENAILLPKRKRWEKFLVLYTTVHEAIL